MGRVASANQAAYRYRDRRQGLEPTSLEVDEGDQVLVSGPSGCGKSTLARCLTGLIPHLYRGELEGTVKLGGLDTSSSPLWQLAERAGLVFQNPSAQMLSLSVEDEIVFGLENLGLPSAAIAERLEAALTRFDLDSMRARSPHTLSGGEQQRLALAAIMAREPPLLVLDEPLSMLDTTASAALVARLGELAGSGTAVVICEHRAEYLSGLPGLRTLPIVGRCAAPVQPAGLEECLAQRESFALQISNLRVRLGQRMVLDDWSMTLQGGQVVAIVGRNGVGKTTLLRAMAGLQEHDGRIRVDGRRPDLGMVFQNADLQLFNASVREEMLYRVPNANARLYTWLLHALQLGDYETFPPLLLSEGEKKRVALATVLMRQPRDGVLFDEPALGQDTAHKAMLMRMAQALSGRGQLVVITTHDLALAAQADRLLLLGPEGPLADGAPADVLAQELPWRRAGLLVPPWVRPQGRVA